LKKITEKNSGGLRQATLSKSCLARMPKKNIALIRKKGHCYWNRNKSRPSNLCSFGKNATGFGNEKRLPKIKTYL